MFNVRGVNSENNTIPFTMPYHTPHTLFLIQNAIHNANIVPIKTEKKKKIQELQHSIVQFAIFAFRIEKNPFIN